MLCVAPAPPASEAGKGRQRHGARHVSDTNTAIAVIGSGVQQDQVRHFTSYRLSPREYSF
jgi:hypothetical protein